MNNAGGWLPGPQFPDTDAWHRSLDLNLRMPMLATQLALPLMHDGGAVINISSSAGWDSAAYGSPRVRGCQGRPDPLHHCGRGLCRPLRRTRELRRPALDRASPEL